jgi:hypothetical protein
VRLHTCRTGDQHLHLNLNARVFAQGRWRALNTVAWRNDHRSIRLIARAETSAPSAPMVTSVAELIHDRSIGPPTSCMAGSPTRPSDGSGAAGLEAAQQAVAAALAGTSALAVVEGAAGSVGPPLAPRCSDESSGWW